MRRRPILPLVYPGFMLNTRLRITIAESLRKLKRWLLFCALGSGRPLFDSEGCPTEG
jgi:hypothetical protein